MKPEPQYWARLADVKAVPTVHEAVRRLRPVDAPDTDGIRGAGVDGAARGAPAPPGLAVAVRPPLILLLLFIALIPCWLLVEPAGGSVYGVLLGALATLLAATTLYCARRTRAAETAANAARRQLAQILDGMREGLFLIGHDLRVSAICSGSAAELLHVSAPAGRRIEELLRPLLDETQLAATRAHLQRLLDDANALRPAELVNPLRQVEVSFANAHGRSERRYLSFSFRRLSGDSDGAEQHILAAVADVTDQVLLVRELEHAKADGDSQADLLLQLVRADPVALVNFLEAADTALRKSNALLTAADDDPPQLQRKLQGVLRELEAITAEAELLPLTSYAQRLHRIDAVLRGLRARDVLTGNDLLPVVVRLDELMTHATTMRSIHQHIVLSRAASAALAALDHPGAPITLGPGVLELS